MTHRPKGRFGCNSGHAVMEACVSGLGDCQLPDFYVMPFLQHGMVELLLEYAQPDDEPIWAVYPQRRHLLPKVQQVVDCLVQELGPAMNSRK
ncbi:MULTISPECIES: LysR substrate-binding domain-containing protein [Sphingomonadaceae]|uniref:LysR substrate-binding domain-containing protein n=1 Tax=Sphingomonadales TaxID=204457 RepID=UPI001F317D29|nr:MULTISPECIES: LysR substrate-binding domain-containing protein [Sphingomonadaceae]WDA39574.1 LysR substrate-binding domain-containing protein [Sphingobium sp. YC-XJ3]WRD78590.1 LysR substrate-binding domain-containing protein [Sphingobium baderi]